MEAMIPFASPFVTPMEKNDFPSGVKIVL